MYTVVYKLADYHIERYDDLDLALARIIILARKGYPKVYLQRRARVHQRGL